MKKHRTTILDPRTGKIEKWEVCIMKDKELQKSYRGAKKKGKVPSVYGYCCPDRSRIAISGDIDHRKAVNVAIHETLHALFGKIVADESVIDGIALSIINVMEVLRFEGKL